MLVRIALAAALLAAPLNGLAQSQAERTGTGGLIAAGQESGSLATTAIIAGAVIAAAVGIAIAVGGSDDNDTAPTSTVVSTTTR